MKKISITKVFKSSSDKHGDKPTNEMEIEERKKGEKNGYRSIHTTLEFKMSMLWHFCKYAVNHEQ